MVISKPRLAHSVSLFLGVVGALGCGTDPSPSSATGGVAAGGTAGSGLGGFSGTPNVGGTSASGAGTGGMAGGSAGAAGTDMGGAGGGGAGGGGAGGAGSDKIHDVSADGDGKIEIGPNYTKDPDLTDLGNPEGKSFQFTFKASQSNIFKGDDPTLTDPVTNQDWGRSVNIYVPALYQDGDEAPILVIQEGQLPNVSRALDNLTISTDPMKKIPPFIAIAVGNGSQRDGSDGKGSERGLEYDTMSDRYTKFIDMEILPAVLNHQPLKQAYPNIKFTSDPYGRATMGCSSGGAAALSMGWFGGTFQRIITYSGTFVTQQNETQPEADMYPMGAWEYHSELELIKNTMPKKPLRVFIHAAENDNGNTQPPDNGRNWVVANERTGEDLMAAGYHHRYVYSLDSGHCEGKIFDATVAQTLSWVWRGYPTE
jgi:enterochelin esterase family protein